MVYKNKKVKIIIADKIDDTGISILKRYFLIKNYYEKNNVELLKILGIERPEVLIVRSFRKIDNHFINKLKIFDSIRVICTASSGYDNIDAEYSKKNNIKVINVPNGNYISAAEHTFALILSIYKNITTADKNFRNHFIDKEFTNAELYSKSIGIIGVGRVGSTVAKLAHSFNMKIYGNDIRDLQSKYEWIKFVSLNNLLKKSDIITFHVPLDNSTINLLNESNFLLLKKNCIVINCSRGGVINELALIDNLKNNKIKFAGLDVFDNEPNINPEFRKLKNVLLTPHIAGKTTESKKRISIQLAKRLVSLYSDKYFDSK